MANPSMLSCMPMSHVRVVLDHCMARPAHASVAEALHAGQVVQQGQACHLYFDLEFCTAANPGLQGEPLVDILIAMVTQDFRQASSSGNTCSPTPGSRACLEARGYVPPSLRTLSPEGAALLLSCMQSCSVPHVCCWDSLTPAGIWRQTLSAACRARDSLGLCPKAALVSAHGPQWCCMQEAVGR